MKMHRIARSVLILTIVGTLVSAQQASAQSVFTGRGAGKTEVLVSRPIALTGVSVPTAGVCALSFSSPKADTVETFDVQVDEEKGAGIGKQLAVFAIITAIVGYAVIELMKSDSGKSTESNTSGKPTPGVAASARITIPLTR